MRRMIADGTIGDVRLWRGIWLSDEFTDPSTPFDWRFDRAMGGTTIADLGSHIDRHGPVDGRADRGGRRPVRDVHPDATRRPDGELPVTIDDASSALLRFEGGARGTIEMARMAVRRPCDFTHRGERHERHLIFEYPRLNELLYGDAATILGCTDAADPGRAPESPVRAHRLGDRAGSATARTS